MQRDKLSDQDFWLKIASLSPNDTASQIDVYNTFYWLNDGKYKKK